MDETEYEHVLTAILLLHTKRRVGQRIARYLGYVDGMHDVILERSIRRQVLLCPYKKQPPGQAPQKIGVF